MHCAAGICARLLGGAAASCELRTGPGNRDAANRAAAPESARLRRETATCCVGEGSY